MVAAGALIGFGASLPAIAQTSTAVQQAAAATPLPTGTYCQGPQTSQPATGPTKVMLINLENESSSAITGSPDAPFENGTLTQQCGTFSTSAMHSTTHPSEGNYFAEVSGLNPAINSGADAQSRFGLSDCPPDSLWAACTTYGSGHFPSSTPSLFSQVEQVDGTSGWKSYSDDMPTACAKNDGATYAHTATTNYQKYVTKHNPAVFWDGIACAANDIPSGDWQHQQGALYSDLMSGSLPAFSEVQPNDIENGHDPVSVNGVTIAGGTSQIGNIDTYLASAMSMIQGSPDYQSGNLVVMITFDEGTIGGHIPGEDAVGENCADPAISPLATSCQVQTWIAGRYIPGYTYTSYMNQFGLLAATERILGLSLLGHAADASTPDIVNGTTGNPDPFNLMPNGAPPPPTVPGAPTGVVVTPGDGQLGLSWTAPASTGGSPITDYVVQERLTGFQTTWQTVLDPISPATTATITGLANGTSYDVQVSAVNSVGTGAASAVATGTPTTATAPPPELLPDPGFESGLGGWGAFLVGNPSTVTSPVHSGSHALKITAPTTAANLVGLTQNTVISNSVAGKSYTASCWVNASAANLNDQIRFLEYNQSFSSTIHFQTVVVSRLTPGVWTQLSVTSAAVNSGERMVPQIYSTNQTSATGTITYDDCSVTAAAAVPVITAPSAPTAVTAVAGNGTATVTFGAPASNGGAPVTGYTVTVSPGGTTMNTTSSPVVFTGLTNGTSYTFTVTATNSAGVGPAAASNAVTPAGPPGSPTGLVATGGESSAALTWTAPASNGSPITSYLVQYSLSGAADWTTFPTPTTPATSATVTGLADGTSYDFQVSAVNAQGSGVPSALAAATPAATAPSAPTIGTATAGDGTASVTFTPPSTTGGSPILQYTVTSTPGGITASGSGSPISVTGLTDGTSYTFTVVATNAVGTSAPSAASNSVVPAPVIVPVAPSAPQNVGATGGSGQAVITFSPPASDGGAPITSYTATSSPGGLTASGPSSPLTVTGLNSTTTYTFTVTATNSAGTSVASAPSPPVSGKQELLPDPGFESGAGGWGAFLVGTLASVSSPVHSGGHALRVTAPTTATNLVGLTQNTVVSNTVAGKSYTASCWVNASAANLNDQIRFLEYNQTFSSTIHFQTVVVSRLTPGVWTQLTVTSTAVNSGDRMVPQIYSTNQTSATGTITYDDCSVTAG